MPALKQQNSTSSSASNTQTSMTNAAKPTDNAAVVPPPQQQQQPAVQQQQEKKLSGAELKKRAKAEKAARRAAEKAKRDAAAGGNVNTNVVNNINNNVPPSHAVQTPKKPVPSKDAQSATPKPFHKRTGSTSTPEKDAKTVAWADLRQAKRERASLNPLLEVEESANKKVALFEHLYRQQRRTNTAGAGKDVHPAVLALGLQLSNYVICGSNARCVATLMAFKKVIESYTTPPGTSLPRHLTSHLSPQIEYLVSCRPMAVSMGNAIRWLKMEISKVDPDTPELEAKTELCEAIEYFIKERITLADEVIANKAVEKIVDGDVILTYAKSSIVQKTIIEAHNRGRKFRVIVVDTRPLFEGKHLARALARLGIDVQYFLIKHIEHAMKYATKVFLGAHAMMGNGRLYSRIGTATVAMTASWSDVPVIVCCESIKFTERVGLDSIVMNEVAPPEELVSDPALAKWNETDGLQLLNLMYDLTPAEFIKMVVCEHGSLPPSSVPVVLSTII